MEGLRRSASRRLAMTVAGAVALAAVWLWSAHALAGSASGTPPEANVGSAHGQAAPAAETRPLLSGSDRNDIGATWTSTVPVTTRVTSGVSQEWVIAQYGVTITFRSNSVSYNAVFTFTPKSEMSLDPPLTSAPYFFELHGVYEFGNPVSLWHDVDITLQYQDSELGDIEEGTLDVFHLAWGEWTSQGAVVDTHANHLQWSTGNLGIFGVGGFAHMVFLPVICNGTSTE